MLGKLLIFNLISFNTVCNTNTNTNANEIKALTRIESEFPIKDTKCKQYILLRSNKFSIEIGQDADQKNSKLYTVAVDVNVPSRKNSTKKVMEYFFLF